MQPLYPEFLEAALTDTEERLNQQFTLDGKKLIWQINVQQY